MATVLSVCVEGVRKFLLRLSSAHRNADLEASGATEPD